MNDLTQVIKSIRLSEKATIGTETNNEYTFKVHPDANKVEIKQAVEKLLGKKVVSVNTANYLGKKKRERRADAGRTAHWKKAVVKLAEGETIDLV
ncbi:50S ribosomal protein L23 [Sulfuriroseicoccus oceanibius]|uniref:Large ribosomal subunit protein uL23 n=1 Tax=Sulfuriroseicoccus oceanibius TaxID=2707525 RepID=A0A6B3L3Y0_9BACT|nr:50S ribosomal protein L23 [Sulfuriroseicoccus oceanibius]QQL45822.1 50S ribosomal protein L23 [Sulfuriroseicoccus oceanibius]